MPVHSTDRPGERARELPRPRAVIFDMDGLLLDSERLALEAFLRAGAEFGWTPDLDVYRRCVGSTYEATARLLEPLLPDGLAYANFDARWSAVYGELLDAGLLEVKPGAVELLTLLAERDVPRALATSTRRALAEHKLALSGLAGFLPHRVCGGETVRGKPHPDPYLAALGLLGTPAAATWACEDSDNGVRAAHAAGLHVIQVPDLVEPGPEVRNLGHLILDDLHAVRARLERVLD
ncbi:MAG: HAD family phosphatase [Pseudomonadales bacterium]|nr:HAD family phosphatase [Pseudomonadales bacterium]